MFPLLYQLKNIYLLFFFFFFISRLVLKCKICMFMLLSSGPIYDIQIKTYSSPSKTLLMWKVQDSLKGRWGGKPQQEPLKGQFLLLTAGPCTLTLVILVFYQHVWHRCCCCFVFKNLIVHVGVRWVVLALWCSTEGLNTPQAPRSQVGV